MKKIILSLCITLLAASAADAGFWVSGKTLKDSNGNTFIPRGISNPHIWYDTDAYNALDNLANSKRCNIIRIVWSTSGSISRLDQIMSRCEALGMVPMPELHDVTGSDSASALNNCAKYFANNASVFKNHANDVLINIANEWGNSSSDAQWRDAYETCISTIRNAGITTTLVIDGAGYGQRSSSALTYGQTLLNYDPQHNILFSIHMYAVWNNSSDIYNCMNSFSSANLPLIIGEFGWNSNNGNNNLGCKVNDLLLMQYANQFGYGYCAWSTKGNDSADAWLDLTTDWNTPTSPWGTDVFWGTYGIYNTAQKATIFTGGGGSQPIANGTYRIMNRNSGKALDASGAGTANGTQIIQWTYGGGNNQRWTVTSLGGNSYKIIGVQSGRALDVYNNATANGTKIELWDYNGGNGQKWSFTLTDSGNYRLTPANATGSCLDVSGASTADGALVQLWSYGGGYNQQWWFYAP